jgi:hypothetical protein
MIRSSWVVIALAIAGGTALAQPGATEPQPPPAAGVQVDVQAGGPVRAPVDLDALVAMLQAEAPSLETIARGTVRRARRAISIGPTVGLWGGAFISPGEVDAALTFGLGLELFKVPVIPGPETIKALVIERVKAKLKDQVVARFQGREADPVEAEAWARQIYEEVKAEVLGLENVRSKTMERPRLTLALEANRMFDADRWLARLRAGVGVWKVTLGVSAAVGRVCRGTAECDDLHAYVGPELVAHFLTSKNPRASVLDVFLRLDFEATGRTSDPYDQLVVGARYLLDLI